MSEIADNFKINLNQNLWGICVGFLSLGLAEYYKLKWLFVGAIILSIIMGLSVLITTIAYTINYWNFKMKKEIKK